MGEATMIGRNWAKRGTKDLPFVIDSPFAFSKVPKECRNVCQPMFLLMPFALATGRI
jgi:hypothetical protein